MISRRKFTEIATILALVAGLLCLFTKPCLIHASEGNQVTISLGVDISTLDPHGPFNMMTLSVWKHMIEPLVMYEYGETAKLVGCLAESWEVNGREWTFKLRKGVKFHNGADFTAHDVKFSLERVKRIGKQAVVIKDLKDIEVVDDYTVKLITEEVVATFVTRLFDIVIVSQQAYEQESEKALKHPIGTGPFKFVEWVRGSHLVAEKNDNYWGGPVKLDRVIWRPIGEDAARITALEKGDVDIAVDIPPHEADRLEKDPNIRIERARSMRLIQVGLHSQFEPFRNKLVRMAMNYAVDIDSLIKNVLEGHAYRATSLSGPSSLGHDPELKPFPYDPSKAKELLAEAGYPNGFEVDFYAPTGRYPKDRELAQAIAGQLAKVGIKAKVITPEWSVYWSSVRAGKYPMLYFGGFNLQDPDIFFNIYFRTGGSKRLEYSNPEVDKAIDEQRREVDLEKREELIRKTIKMILDDVPTILLYHHQKLYGVRERVVWKPTPEETVMVRDASVRK